MAGGDNASSDNAAAAVCPVDHKTRDLWLAQARAQAQTQTQGAPATPLPPQHPPVQTPAAATPSRSWWLPSLWSSSSSAPAAPTEAAAPASPHAFPHLPKPAAAPLNTNRVVSSIPRTESALPEDGISSAGSAAPACPVNHEVETGADPASGNWVYPSEKMFFDAMRRKGNDGARPADMRVVVPIHNAVNERAWKEILEWEAPYAGAGRACNGPRLHSFAGLSDTRMSPRARLYTLLGYSAPFDRHDWVIDRCGTRVEYVIDFYAGRPTAVAASNKTPSGHQPQISFYLDVRPKLNTWEGVRMRAARAIGLA